MSFGAVGSVISLPCRISHAAIPPEVRKARALPEGLVRLSVGLEDVDDLVAAAPSPLTPENLRATIASKLQVKELEDRWANRCSSSGARWTR